MTLIYYEWQLPSMDTNNIWARDPINKQAGSTHVHQPASATRSDPPHPIKHMDFHFGETEIMHSHSLGIQNPLYRGKSIHFFKIIFYSEKTMGTIQHRLSTYPHTNIQQSTASSPPSSPGHNMLSTYIPNHRPLDLDLHNQTQIIQSVVS